MVARLRKHVAAMFACGLVACSRTDGDTSPDASSSAAQAAGIDPDAGDATSDARRPGLFRMGRFERSPSGALRFAWSGSTIRARFRGRAARVRLRDELGHNYFRVSVDGATSVVETKPGEHEYLLADALPLEEHSLELVKRTEARSGEVELVALDLAGGELLPEPPHKPRMIEVLGDSISTGWGVLGVDDVACPDAAKLTDETETAGARVAELLDAEHATIAWSAKTIREMTTLWERTLPARETSRWDFSVVPDAVIVNLGTNDFYTGAPGRDAFVKRYTALLDKLRARYPTTFIVAVLGPMLSDAYPENKHSYTLAQGHLRAAIDHYRSRGDTHLALLDFGPADPKDGYGCRFHPNPITQRKMADAIARVLRENLSW